MSHRIEIRRESGQRNAYLGGELIASIYDHRRAPKAGSKTDRFSNIQDNWGVAWRSGRFDWHGSYKEARDNVLKGPKAVPPARRGESLLCGACLTVLLGDRPPGRMVWCVNDRCAQRGTKFHR